MIRKENNFLQLGVNIYAQCAGFELDQTEPQAEPVNPNL